MPSELYSNMSKINDAKNNLCNAMQNIGMPYTNSGITPTSYINNVTPLNAYSNSINSFVRERGYFYCPNDDVLNNYFHNAERMNYAFADDDVIFGDGFFPKNNRKAKFERIIKKTQ